MLDDSSFVIKFSDLDVINLHQEESDDNRIVIYAKIIILLRCHIIFVRLNERNYKRFVNSKHLLFLVCLAFNEGDVQVEKINEDFDILE